MSTQGNAVVVASPRALTAEETATRLGVTTFTLANWRQNRRGPNYLRFNGRAVRYPLAEIEAFEAASAVRHPASTADAV